MISCQYFGGLRFDLINEFISSVNCLIRLRSPFQDRFEFLHLILQHYTLSDLSLGQVLSPIRIASAFSVPINVIMVFLAAITALISCKDLAAIVSNIASSVGLFSPLL